MTFWEPGPDGGVYEVLPSDFIGGISHVELTPAQLRAEEKRLAARTPLGFAPPSVSRSPAPRRPPG